jgi:hypothetical protein
LSGVGSDNGLLLLVQIRRDSAENAEILLGGENLLDYLHGLLLQKANRVDSIFTQCPSSILSLIFVQCKLVTTETLKGRGRRGSRRCLQKSR